MEFTEERLTPLDHALLHGQDEAAQYLIEQGEIVVDLHGLDWQDIRSNDIGPMLPRHAS